MESGGADLGSEVERQTGKAKGGMEWEGEKIQVEQDHFRKDSVKGKTKEK